MYKLQCTDVIYFALLWSLKEQHIETKRGHCPRVALMKIN
jgi:hypothetical protein